MINFAEKYSKKIDERFKLGALTSPAVNEDYDFVGVKTIHIYSVPTVEMTDYQRTGLSRYGTPEELENSVQEMTLTRDRSFTFTIDKGNFTDTMMINAAGQALQRQIDERVIPEIDIYRLSTICANAGNASTGEITAANAYEAFLDAGVTLTNNKVPAAGRIAYITPSFYKSIKLDDSFIKASDIAQNMLLKGQIGQVDGIPLIMVPALYLPENVSFMVTNRIATVAPIKLTEYKVHENPPGINGHLVEGRLYYDAFVLENKKSAIYVHKNA